MRILVTGAAGFIGYHLCARLLSRGDEILGLDNLNSYYDVSLKKSRLNRLKPVSRFQFEKLDVADPSAVDRVFGTFSPQIVVHLAAQAGVRHSLDQPREFCRSNIDGFLNILEGCRHHAVDHLVYASSSSVYGANQKMPFSEMDPTHQPLSFLAATKRANELMAESYSHLFGIPTTGLRFFTVYGPWGRPDMALFLFVRQILEGKPIEVYHHGEHRRDFTYIDDLIEILVRVLDRPPSGSTEKSSVRHKIYNVGTGRPVALEEFIAAIENELGVRAQRKYLPRKPVDMMETFADMTNIRRDFQFSPQITLEEGIARFVKWYKDFYGLGYHSPTTRNELSSFL